MWRTTYTWNGNKTLFTSKDKPTLLLMLHILNEFMVESVILIAVIYRGRGIRANDSKKLNQLI